MCTPVELCTKSVKLNDICIIYLCTELNNMCTCCCIRTTFRLFASFVYSGNPASLPTSKI